MHSRVITPRRSVQRTQTRPQQALRPINYGIPGERVLGGMSQEEVRNQQLQKYRVDSEKYAEKEKEKVQKKKEDKWKRYSHVDLGRQLNSNENEIEFDFETVREQQQLMYELEAPVGLEAERQREAARLRREERQKEEKFKKYSHVSSGQRLSSAEQVTCTIPAETRQSEYKIRSADGLEREKQKEAARLENERQRRELKMKRYDHVDLSRQLNENVPSSSGYSRSSSLNISSDGVAHEVGDINLNVNYDRAMEQKTKHYQNQKLKTDVASLNVACIAGPSSPQLNNLNENSGSEAKTDAKSSDAAAYVTLSEANKDKENRERMRLARERFQKKYDEELRKSS